MCDDPVADCHSGAGRQGAKAVSLGNSHPHRDSFAAKIVRVPTGEFTPLSAAAVKQRWSLATVIAWRAVVFHDDSLLSAGQIVKPAYGTLVAWLFEPYSTPPQ